MIDKLDLPAVSAAALTEFEENEYHIISKVVEKAQTQISDSMPEGGSEVLRAGMEFTVSSFRNAMNLGELTILENQINWGMDRLPHDGVKPTNVYQNFQLMADAVDELLSPESAQQIRAYVDWCVAKIKEMLNT